MHTNKKLRRLLQTVGMVTFAKDFYMMNNLNESKKHILNYLVKVRTYKKSSARAKLYAAQNIVKNHNIPEALKLIINSNRTDMETKRTAKRVLIDLVQKNA